MMSPQERLKKIYVTSVDKRDKITFLGTLVIGIVAHFFVLSNVVNNYDNIRFTPYGAGVDLSSGRWVLHLINNTWNKVFFGGGGVQPDLF